MPKIRASGLTRTFGRGSHLLTALGPVELEVARGEFVCVVGPSGCGKSTLLRIAARPAAPLGGRAGTAHRRPPPRRHDLPGLRHLRLEDRPGQRPLRPRRPARPPQGGRHTRPGVAGQDGSGRIRGRLPRRALRRHAAARGHRPRPRRGTGDPPDGRALRGPGRPAAHHPPGRAARPHPGHQHHHLVHHPQPRRGPRARGPRPGDVRRTRPDHRRTPTPFGRPRTGEVRSDPGFTALKDELWELLRYEVRQAGQTARPGQQAALA